MTVWSMITMERTETSYLLSFLKNCHRLCSEWDKSSKNSKLLLCHANPFEILKGIIFMEVYVSDKQWDTMIPAEQSLEDTVIVDADNTGSGDISLDQNGKKTEYE